MADNKLGQKRVVERYCVTSEMSSVWQYYTLFTDQWVNVSYGRYCLRLPCVNSGTDKSSTDQYFVIRHYCKHYKQPTNNVKKLNKMTIYIYTSSRIRCVILLNTCTITLLTHGPYRNKSTNSNSKIYNDLNKPKYQLTHCVYLLLISGL